VKQPVLGVTMGDPAGVGPEIIARAAAEPAVRATARPVVIGAAAAMREALALVGSRLALHAVRRVADCRWADGTLDVYYGMADTRIGVARGRVAVLSGTTPAQAVYAPARAA